STFSAASAYGCPPGLTIYAKGATGCVKIPYTDIKMRIARIALLVCFAFALAGGVDKDEAFIGARRNYWAFRAPVRPEVPAVQSAWVSNPIDAFIIET